MKKILIILGIVLMLFISGCTSGSTGAKKNGFQLKGAFNGGNEGLSLEFTPNQPPEKIMDRGIQDFSIRVLIENLGESDIAANSGHITISGINPQDYGINISSQVLPELKGVKKQGDNIIPGNKQIVMFSGLKYISQIAAGVLNQKLSLDLCYPYKTKSLISICIAEDTFQYSNSGLEICNIEGTKEYANSGAPVQIENVKQTPAGSSSIQIQFDIVHNPSSENGRVFELSSLDSDCKVSGRSVLSTEASLKQNWVTYTVDTGIAGLKCGTSNSNTDKILLSDNRATVYCTQDTTGQEDYEKPITITLYYDYFDRISKNIQIQHIER